MIMKIFHQAILKWRWRRLTKLINRDNELRLIKCVRLTNLFNKHTTPTISLLDCNTIYFIPTIISLNSLINELQKVVTSFEKTKAIAPVLGRSNNAKITVAYWVMAKQADEAYLDLSLYEGYQIASKLIVQLHTIAVTDYEKTYLERRCNRLFMAYIQLVIIIMEHKYDRERR